MVISVWYWCHLERPQNLPYGQFPTCHIVSQAQVGTTIVFIWQLIPNSVCEVFWFYVQGFGLQLPQETTLTESQSKDKYKTFRV